MPLLLDPPSSWAPVTTPATPARAGAAVPPSSPLVSSSAEEFVSSVTVRRAAVVRRPRAAAAAAGWLCLAQIASSISSLVLSDGVSRSASSLVDID